MAEIGTIKKSILIIDTPESCGECICYRDVMGNCLATEDYEDVEKYEDKGRPEFCPLRDVEIKPTFE